MDKTKTQAAYALAQLYSQDNTDLHHIELKQYLNEHAHWSHKSIAIRKTSLKEELTGEQYLEFVTKAENYEYWFFTYDNNEFKYFGFHKKEDDKYLKQIALAKEKNILYEINIDEEK